MTDSQTIYVPFSTYVSVRSFTNASFNQRATVLEENGTKHQYEGSGEHDTPMPGGNFAIQTPVSGKSPNGYQITVTVENYQGGGWKQSSVSQGGCSVMFYHLAMIVSEDYVDNDWNDCSVQFTWWIPPS